MRCAVCGFRYGLILEATGFAFSLSRSSIDIIFRGSTDCRMSLPKIEITGVPVTALSFNRQIDVMVDWAKQRSSKVVCVANVHMLMDSRWNTDLRAVLDQSDLTTPDGMPLVWVMRLLGVRSQDRVAGMDIFLSVCAQAIEHGLSVYLLGSTPEVLGKMKMRLAQEFPNLEIAGLESPPFRPLTAAEDAALVNRINDSGAAFTLISLGCPKQECWMGHHIDRVNSVMIGLGAVFPVYARVKKYAPKWVRESGLEWLYRLVQEPRRLFGRYVRTIPPFIWLAIQQISSRDERQRPLRF